MGVLICTTCRLLEQLAHSNFAEKLESNGIRIDRSSSVLLPQNHPFGQARRLNEIRVYEAFHVIGTHPTILKKIREIITRIDKQTAKNI